MSMAARVLRLLIALLIVPAFLVLAVFAAFLGVVFRACANRERAWERMMAAGFREVR